MRVVSFLTEPPVVRKIIEHLQRTDSRGGPRILDSLLRWNPDREGDVWNAPKETQVSA